jgi:serine phosphatase RsbU (regulator of sigma subunit)
MLVPPALPAFSLLPKHAALQGRAPRILATVNGKQVAIAEVLRRQLVQGAEYLLNTPGVPRLAVITAFENHMKYDRSGYPKVPPDWQINLCSQMTMISDCFDAIRFSRSRVALSIADVVGKGIPAALLMSNLQAAVRAFATEAARPAELCEQVNAVLCGHIAEGRFISFFYCVADGEVGMLSYANAGHFPPFVVRADGSVEHLTSGGAVLGVFPDGVYEAASIPFSPGDRLVLYTDGITEARNDADEEFGEARLTSMAVEHRGCSAPALQARLVDAVASFTSRHFTDDATLMVLAAEN